MSTMEIGKYRQYFDIDENYFPCIDDSAIEAGARWETTYPHEAFITLLKDTERMLGGSTKRSIWIHGAYGTGKSQCAYALKKILEVPEEELKAYWDKYDSLKSNTDLLQKILGHKERKILTCFRYASGDITTPRDLFFAIQDRIKHALNERPDISYSGENTLKESVIEWISESSHKNFINELLQKPEWSSSFAQSSADEILHALQSNSDVKSLMNNIFRLADKEGIVAMSLDADKLKSWIKDLIIKNDIKIVFIWDEFSGFFKQNRNSLDEFQKIVALCQDVPFYLVVVTHQTDSLINSEDQSWSIVQQRFNFVPITLPNNIGFSLIGHAFNIKPAAKSTWDKCAADLNARLTDSRKKVMETAKISDNKVIKDIMPIHPMAALVLKNIAEAFKSNQRSMFDFIKTSNNENVKAFQWFIENTGPSDEHPLLTIDLLWNFFYETGRDNLSADIRMILDAYPQQHSLREDEQRVLKTILIMQAIDKRLGGSIDLLKPTEQNISYAFEGITSGLDTSCKNVAKGLTKKGILVSNSIGNNKFAYGAAVLAGDQAKIDEYKKGVRQASKTEKLVSDGGLSTVLSLPPALKLRYTDLNGSLPCVTSSDFTRIINNLKNHSSPWHFNAVIAFAKDDNEAISFRKTIKEAALNPEYNDIVFIDALSSPLGEDDFNSYIDNAAMAQYYQGNNNNTARDYSNKALQILSNTWKNRIYNGSFTIYYDKSPNGEKVSGGGEVANILKEIVLRRLPLVFDFSRGLTENQLKLTQGKSAAKSGIIKKTSGVVTNVEKSVLPEVWSIEKYWDDPKTNALTISTIKRRVDEVVKENFDADGQVSICDLYDLLENEFGFAPCNLSAFLTGFLLKEYSSEPYRYSDASGSNEVMSPDKLSEMIGNYIKNRNASTYIVKMTPEEKAFYDITEKAWNLPNNSCSSPTQAGILVKNKMNSLGLPIWCLEEVDTDGVFDIIKKYIRLVQSEGGDAHTVAIEIGSAAKARTSLASKLNQLISVQNCRKGMESFLNRFEGRRLLDLAEEIGANEQLFSDISDLFSVQNSSLWNEETGKDQLRILITDYYFVQITNSILNSKAHSKKEAIREWCDHLGFVMCSCEALQEEYPNLKTSLEFLLKIFKESEILPEQMKEYTNALAENYTDIKSYFSNEYSIFQRIYSSYLEDFTEEEISQLKNNDLTGIFKKSRSESNNIVKQVADDFRKGQAKTSLFMLWKEKTGTKTPIDWSSKNRTPILLLVKKDEYDDAKKAFEVLNGQSASEHDILDAIAYLNKTDLFSVLDDKEYIDASFRDMLGRYSVLLSDIEKVRNAISKLAINTYEWDTHPIIQTTIEELAKQEYDASGRDQVFSKIEKMDNQALKQYLLRLVKENMNLGVEIINGGE